MPTVQPHGGRVQAAKGKEEMRKYTTPTLVVRIDGKNLEECDVYVTLAQGNRRLTYTNDDFESVEADACGVTAKILLTQEQTASFSMSQEVSIQANVIDKTGHRAATDIMQIGIWKNLLEEVIEYENQTEP